MAKTQLLTLKMIKNLIIDLVYTSYVTYIRCVKLKLKSNKSKVEKRHSTIDQMISLATASCFTFTIVNISDTASAGDLTPSSWLLNSYYRLNKIR